MSLQLRKPNRPRRVAPLRLGFLPENDCAPAVVAQEAGFFSRHGLSVRLVRETSCSGLRDRLLEGQLDAAIAPATLPFVLNLGLDFGQCPCVTGLVTSLQGNAIAVSRRLWDKGVHDSFALRDRVCKDWNRHTYTFAVGFPHSPQYFLLAEWLRASGLLPHTQVRIVSMAPEQMFPALELGYLDGFCVGAPWSNVAEEAGKAVTLTTSSQLAPLHPEKALLATSHFATARTDEHERLVAALIEAGRYCEHPKSRERIPELLARPQYVNAPASCIRVGFLGPYPSAGRRLHSLHALNVFAAHHANVPSRSRAEWVLQHLFDHLHLRPTKIRDHRWTQTVFRQDIHDRALSRLDAAPRWHREKPGTEKLCVNA